MRIKEIHKIVYLLITVVIVSGCSAIRNHRNFQQPLEQSLTASVGSALVRMNRIGDLPNAYGGRDIYGGKVDKGYVEVKLVEITDTKGLTLSVSDVAVQSTESTMTRYVNPKLVDVTQNVNISSSDNSSTIVEIDGNAENEYVIGGVKITFLEIRKSSIVYTIEDLMAVK